MMPRVPPHYAQVTTREELIYLLSRASELEHGLACVYLFAAHSLKADIGEGGLTETEASMVLAWKRALAGVAIEEMLHLAQVTNMLTAIGGAPHFRRTNFPLPAEAFPLGLPLSLEPFSPELIERFVCYEMPAPGTLTPDQDAAFAPIRERVFASEATAVPVRWSTDQGITPPERILRGGCEPFEVDYATVGEFYHKIASAFDAIPEDRLFIGPREAQAEPDMLDFGGQLLRVTDRASAHAAVAMIVEQGEASSQGHPDGHFMVFDGIRRELSAAVEAARAEGRDFVPTRPVTPNPMTRFYDDATGGTVISNANTHAVADLFNGIYETMLLILLRFFAHTDESKSEHALLAQTALRAMATVLRPLGEALTKLAISESDHTGTAGPGFGYNRDIHLLPHKQSAWIFFDERLRELASRASSLRSTPGMPMEMNQAASAFDEVVRHFKLDSAKT